MLIMAAHSGGAFSPTARSTLQEHKVFYTSDKVFLLAVVPGVLEGRVTLQGCVRTLCKLCAFGFVSVVGALVSVQVAKHEKEKADQDQGHSSDHSCKRKTGCGSVWGRVAVGFLSLGMASCHLGVDYTLARPGSDGQSAK